MQLVHADGTDITAAAPAAYTEPALSDLDREVTFTDGVYQEVPSETGSSYRRTIAFPGETLTRRAYLARAAVPVPTLKASNPTLTSRKAALANATALALTGLALDRIDAIEFKLADGDTAQATLSGQTETTLTATVTGSTGAGLRGVYATVAGIKLLLWGSIV